MIRYHPDGDDRELAEGLDRPFAELLPLSRLHSPGRDDSSRWPGLADLGLFGIAIADEHGGAGLDATTECLVAVRAGRQLAAPGIFATMAAAHAVGDGELAARIADGSARVAGAWPSADGPIVADAAGADAYLLRTDDTAELILRSDNDQLIALDEEHWLASLSRLSAIAPPVARAKGPALLRVRLIDAAALIGLAEAALDMAVAYAKVRRQFGHPIGAFQAIKHDCADMAIRHRAAADQLGFAAVALNDRRDDAPLQVEAALLLAMEAALDNAARSIQVHGGIGFSDEADPHLLVKRARLLVTIAGGIEAATARMAGARAAF